MTDHYIDIDMVQSYIAYLYTDFAGVRRVFCFTVNLFGIPNFGL